MSHEEVIVISDSDSDSDDVVETSVRHISPPPRLPPLETPLGLHLPGSSNNFDYSEMSEPAPDNRMINSVIMAALDRLNGRSLMGAGHLLRRPVFRGRGRGRRPGPHTRSTTARQSPRVVQSPSPEDDLMEPFFHQLYPGLSFGTMMEDTLLNQALLMSMNDTGVESPSLEVDELDKPGSPPTARPDFTRGLTADTHPMCAFCDTELGVGVEGGESEVHDDPEHLEGRKASPKTLRKQRGDFQKAIGYISDTDRLLSKRVFFAKCGHVYCGRCVNQIVNRQRTKLGPPKTCAVKDCKQSFSRSKTPFLEVFF